MEKPGAQVAEAAPMTNGHGPRFVIDARRSRFTVQAFATGVLAAMGHDPTIGIRTFAGEVGFDADGLRAGRLTLTIDSASLSVLDDVSDKDRREIERVMKSEVLEVEKYPEINYEASQIAIARVDSALYKAAVNGDLRFHGVTRKQPLTVRIAMLGTMLRGSGEFTLKQSDFQIKPVSVAGGILKVKDELKFSFEMIANRHEPEE